MSENDNRNEAELFAAIENQELEELIFVMKSGCNLHVYDIAGNTALHKAVLKGDLTIIKVNLFYIEFSSDMFCNKVSRNV